jgi:23S rRNA (adenine2503-C2)-methyltransferase
VDTKPDVRSFLHEELEARLKAAGQPAYRATQLLEWLYPRGVTSWEAMTNLPAAFRQALREQFSLETLELVRKQGSKDTTRKFLWRLVDGALIESVLIPANPALYGEPSDRFTLCVSTQVGCAYGCKFCASGLDGWKRNLATHEIVGQVLASRRSEFQVPTRNPNPNPEHGTRNTERIDNLVIMGMGEPLANYDPLLKALRILNAPWGGGIGARKITVSTSGLAPQIRRLADEPEQFRLAVSLHAATDEVRNRIMPVNRKFPLKELVAALEYYHSRKGRMMTFEYILIEGVNDSPRDARSLAALARKLQAKVNLIPYNTVEGLDWRRPGDDVCEAFLAALERQKVTATLRREKGHDIDAACGQLRLKESGSLVAKGSGI